MKQRRILPIRDTEENLELINPVLGKQELVKVFCKDGSSKFKIGDGLRRYRELPFVKDNKIEVRLDEDLSWGKYLVRFTIKQNETI